MKRHSTVLALLAAAALGISLTSVRADDKPTNPHTTTPAATPATKIEKKAVDTKASDTAEAKLGAKAPEFTLTDTDGKTVKLGDLLAQADTKAVVIEWFNPECPFVVKQHSKNTTMPDTYNAFKGKGVKWIAINSGAAGKDGAGKDASMKAKTGWKIEYPILIDESGEVGMKYGAKRTPQMFIINKEGTLVYDGAIDNNPSADKAGDKNYVKMALEEVLAGKKVTVADAKAYGCTVKYADKKTK